MASYSECDLFTDPKDKNVCLAKIDLYNHLNNNVSLEKFLKDATYMQPTGTGTANYDSVIEQEISTILNCSSTALSTAQTRVNYVTAISGITANTAVPYNVALLALANSTVFTTPDARAAEAREQAGIIEAYKTALAIEALLPDAHFWSFTTVAPFRDTYTASLTAAAALANAQTAVTAAVTAATAATTAATAAATTALTNAQTAATGAATALTAAATAFTAAATNATTAANATVSSALANARTAAANARTALTAAATNATTAATALTTAANATTAATALANARTAATTAATAQTSAQTADFEAATAQTAAVRAAREDDAKRAVATQICSAGQVGTVSVKKRMHVPTNITNRLNLIPRTTYSTLAKIISFEIVKEYDVVQSAKIYRAIHNSTCNSNSCRAGKGSDIVFDEYGNVSIKWKAGAADDQTEIFKNENLQSNLQENIEAKDFLSSSLDTETDAIEYINEGIWDISSKFFMNHSGTYIIYTPWKKVKLDAWKAATKVLGDTAANATYTARDGATAEEVKEYEVYKAHSNPPIGSLADGEFKYYLLYNPIHSIEFQIVYRLLTEINNPNTGTTTGTGGTTTTTTTDRTVYFDKDRGYMESALSETIKLPNDSVSASTRYTMTIPSYLNIISRYCNAFKIKGHPLPNNVRGEIFLDPVCSVAMNPNMAELSFILGQNYTQECLSYDYWSIEGNPGDANIEKTRSLNGQKDLKSISPGWAQATITDGTPRWACKTHVVNPGDTALSWLEKVSKNFTLNSTSFINVLARSYVQRDAGIFVTTANRRAINYTPTNLIIQPPTCNNLASADNVICNSKMEFNGDAVVSENEINFINACNGHGTGLEKSGSVPKIFTFAVSLPEGEALKNSYAAQLLPIFEGGTGTISASPQLSNETDLAVLSNSVLSGRIINIRTVSQRTTFRLTVTSSPDPVTGLTNSETEQVVIPKINNILPPDSNLFGVDDSLFWPIVTVIFIIIIGVVFLIV